MSETTEKKIHFEASTIETIDKSVYNFVTSLALSTMTNKGFKNVPVIWGTAERAYQAKGDKRIRDPQGLLVLPIISIKRSSFTKSVNTPGIFQGNIPEADDSQGGSVDVGRVLYHEKTLKFANADALRLYGQKNFPSANPKVVYRTISAPMPVNVEAMYEITLRTEYQQQMNDLMVPFIAKPGTVNFVRLIEGEHKYEGFIQESYASTDNLSDFSADERRFETKITIKVIGYVVGEGVNRDKPAYAVRENIVEVKIPRERITLGEIPEHEFGSYYGLPGASFTVGSDQEIESPFDYHNVPAASFFEGGGSPVTTENFASILNQFFVVRETLKEEDEIPASLTNFNTSQAIRENSEQVLINGVLQAYGPTKDYIVSGTNTIVFTENVENGDYIVVTYIKG
jgi:hypothetical protein